jgi:hypothetical protein
MVGHEIDQRFNGNAPVPTMRARRLQFARPPAFTLAMDKPFCAAVRWSDILSY